MSIQNYITENKFTAKIALLMGLIVFALSGCATKMDAATLAAKQNYYASQVTTSRSAGFSTGLKLITNEDPEVLAARFESEAKARISSDIRQYMKGTKPAKVNVLLEEVSFASAGGRILLSSDSRVVAIVTITDANTNAVIASKRIAAVDAGVKGYGVAGAVLAVAINAANSAENKRISNLIKALSGAVYNWIGRKG